MGGFIMKESIIITVINAIKDIALAIFNVFHKKSKSSTEIETKEEPKTPKADKSGYQIEIPPSPTIIEAEPVDKTIITNQFIVSDSELENMDINDPTYFEKMGARLMMSRSNEDVEIL